MFATLGVLATGATLCVFIMYRETPVVKASGRELSLYLLSAVFISFFATFIIVHKPTPAICGTTRMLIGLCYGNIQFQNNTNIIKNTLSVAGLCFTMLYASILTKTSRIARIFNNSGQKPKRAKYTSPRSQLVIVNMLLMIEVCNHGCKGAFLLCEQPLPPVSL